MPDWLSLVDVAFAGVALLFAWGGFQKGFAAQMAHILTFVIMGAVLFFAYPALFGYLNRVFRNLEETYLMWLILALLAILALGVFVLIGKLLSNRLKTQISERSDHVCGFALGFVRGGLVALFAMVFLVMLGPSRIYDNFQVKSRVGQLVCKELVPRIQPHFTRDMLEEKVGKLKDKLLERKEAGVFE